MTVQRIHLAFLPITLAATVLPFHTNSGASASQVTEKAAGIQPSEYQARRAALAKAIGADAIFIGFSAASARRTGDVDWPFRQEDNLLYLTGVNSPDTTLALIPADRSETIFVTDPNPAREAWTGRIPTHEEVTAINGIRDVESASRFESFVEAVFQGLGWGESDTYGYYRAPSFPGFLRSFSEGRAEVWLLLDYRSQPGEPSRENRFAADLGKRFPEIRIRNASPILTAMREVKSPAEIALIQRSIDITAEAQKAAMRRVLTATREYEVQATIEYTFRNLGACCWAFPSIVGAGENATILHYESNNDPVFRTGLLLTDIGAEVQGYSADITRTYPANGRFSQEQRAVYEAVVAAQNECLDLMRPGRLFGEVQTKAQEVIGRGLLRLGLVSKSDLDQVRLYFFHGIGHPLGLQTHDVFDPARRFEPNMVVTDEPGIYVRRNDVLASEVFRKLQQSEQDSIRKALDRYAGIGIRIEDDVLITDRDPKILSGAAPRTAAEIEAWMAKRD